MAPADWGVLQLWTNNPSFYKYIHQGQSGEQIDPVSMKAVDLASQVRHRMHRTHRMHRMHRMVLGMVFIAWCLAWCLAWCAAWCLVWCLAWCLVWCLVWCLHGA